MPQYFVTARNPSGRTLTELLEAESARAAIKTLEDRGCENIVLHTDDAGAQIVRPIETTPLLTAHDVVQNRFRGGFQQTVIMALRAYAMTWKFVALTLTAFCALRLLDVPFGIFDGIIAGGLLVPLVVVFFGRSGPNRYQRLLEAESWRRWDDALRLLPLVEDKLSPFIGAWHRAKALAGLGRLDDALEVFMPFATDNDIPKQRFWTLLATVYRIADQDDLVIAAYEQALEIAPDDPATMIGLANTLLEEREDVTRAKELLQRAKQQPLSDLADAFVWMAEGTIAQAEGNIRLAVERFEQALVCKRRYAKGHPSSAAVADLLEGRLALAKALAGDLDAGRRHFLRAEPRLRALKQKKLLTRCQQKLGLSA